MYVQIGINIVSNYFSEISGSCPGDTIEDQNDSMVCICPGDKVLVDDSEGESGREPDSTDPGTCDCPTGTIEDDADSSTCKQGWNFEFLRLHEDLESAAF